MPTVSKYSLSRRTEIWPVSKSISGHSSPKISDEDETIKFLNALEGPDIPIKNPEMFKDTLDQRMKAKHNNDTRTAKTLKTPLNVVSGATEQTYNDLFDPKQARSMRISGQLFLTELVEELVASCTVRNGISI
jgi:hypothetical protein